MGLCCKGNGIDEQLSITCTIYLFVVLIYLLYHLKTVQCKNRKNISLVLTYYAVVCLICDFLS